jgi:hypothetical protein
MKVELRDGLVEVPGGLPTFASDGLERAAATIGGIASDSYEYLAALLDYRPEAQVLVLSEADWATKSEQPLYGLPNAGDGTLTVAGIEAPFWADLAGMVADDDRAELDSVYVDGDGQLRFGPFFDLVAVHEVGHLFSQGVVHFPRLWLSELFANLCLHAWVERCSPASLATLITLPRLGAKAPAAAWPYRTWEEFERVYSSMPGPNYVWFQFRLQLAAAELHRRGGEDTLRRLYNAFRLDDQALASVLSERVDPGLADLVLSSEATT